MTTPRQTVRSLASPTPPEPGNPDRKRVLNVLAQRRYRQRKRERIAALEAQAKTSSIQPHLGNERSLFSLEEPIFPSPSTSSEDDNPISSLPLPSLGSIGIDPQVLTVTSGQAIAFPSLTREGNATPAFSTTRGAVSDQLDFSFDGILNLSLVADEAGTPLFPAEPQQTEPRNGWNQQFHEEVFTDARLPLPADTRLEVPVLKTLHAALRIAQMLDCETTIWDPSHRRTLVQSSLPSTLPSNFYPTSAQASIPHHPLLDILPFPTLRTKLIVIFSLPPALRPPKARDDMALVQLAYDIEDEAEGLRIVGEGTSLREEEWEVGMKVFENWWWAFDREIVQNSNRIRERRGAARLRVTEER